MDNCKFINSVSYGLHCRTAPGGCQASDQANYKAAILSTFCSICTRFGHLVSLTLSAGSFLQCHCGFHSEHTAYRVFSVVYSRISALDCIFSERVYLYVVEGDLDTAVRVTVLNKLEVYFGKKCLLCKRGDVGRSSQTCEQSWSVVSRRKRHGTDSSSYCWRLSRHDVISSLMKNRNWRSREPGDDDVIFDHPPSGVNPTLFLHGVWNTTV